MPLTSEAIDCLRIDDREWRKVVGELQHELSRDRKGRQMTRMLYTHVSRVEVAFSQPGGSEKAFFTRPYHISAQGMALLHGQYVYQGSGAQLKLQSIVTGEQEVFTGKVMSCRFIRGRIHEVGIHFDYPIEIEDFVNETSALASYA